MIRVLALLPYPTGQVPGQRYRIEQWLPLLRDEGLDVSVSTFLSLEGMRGHALVQMGRTARGYLRRLGELMRVDRFDVVFLYREASLLGPAWIERLLSHRAPVVYDFDDAIHLKPPVLINDWANAFRFRAKAATICRLARHVTVGNEFLADFARRFSDSVTVVPTTIDTDAYQVRPRPPNPRPVVGWTGSPTTVCYLETVIGALDRLRREVDFELRVIGGEIRIPGLQTSCLPWRPETEAEDVASFDVGLMPLADDDWCRGKCGLKALQYMALGIPAVVSPVGVGAEIVRDGVSGFHARTEDEWVERIRLLLKDAELRARLGKEARRTVEERYSARVQAPRMAQVLRSAAARR